MVVFTRISRVFQGLKLISVDYLNFHIMIRIAENQDFRIEIKTFSVITGCLEPSVRFRLVF